MSNTRIVYGSTGTGQQVQNFVNEVETVLAMGRRLMAKLNAASNGGDWTGLENEVGGMVAGTGQATWSVLATAMAQIDSPQVAELARLDKS